MTLVRLKKLIIGIGFVFVLLFGSSILVGTTAQAGGRNPVVYDHREDRERGFRDGQDRGREDARDGRSFNPNNSEHYRHGNRAYKDGFRQGYREGYGRRGRRF